MENKVVRNDQIDLLRLFEVLKKKIWLIITVGLLFACAAAGYTKFFITPTYTSVSTVLVLPKGGSTITSISDLQFVDQISKDYTVLTVSRPVLESVIDNLDLQMSYKALRSCINITNDSGTRILTLSVTMTDPKMAKAVVDELARVSSAYIADKMEVPAPKVIEEGELPVYKNGPDMKKNVMKGLLVGVALVCGILVVLEMMNDSIKTEDDIEKYLGIPTLGLIPDKGLRSKKKKSKKQGKVS